MSGCEVAKLYLVATANVYSVGVTPALAILVENPAQQRVQAERQMSHDVFVQIPPEPSSGIICLKMLCQLDLHVLPSEFQMLSLDLIPSKSIVNVVVKILLRAQECEDRKVAWCGRLDDFP